MIMKQLAKAIKESGQSRYQISKATGIDQAVLCRIATGSGTGSCSLKTLDVLCEYLGLELVKEDKKSKNAKNMPLQRRK
jgi:DNA-binding Xre family transcriptional regulator